MVLKLWLTSLMKNTEWGGLSPRIYGRARRRRCHTDAIYEMPGNCVPADVS